MGPLLEEVSAKHFPNPPATAAEIAAFENRVGWQLDPDLRAFYLHCNGTSLFGQIDTPYRFPPLAEIVRGRVAIFGKDHDDDAHGPASWYSICTLYDGDCALVDIGTIIDGRYPIRDGWHEAFPNPEDCKQIESSFAAFLSGALRSEGLQYWLRRS